MTKTKHPKSRAERLALKEQHEAKKTYADKVRQHLKEALKERETKDELREYAADYRVNSVSF